MMSDKEVYARLVKEARNIERGCNELDSVLDEYELGLSFWYLGERVKWAIAEGDRKAMEKKFAKDTGIRQEKLSHYLDFHRTCGENTIPLWMRSGELVEPEKSHKVRSLLAKLIAERPQLKSTAKLVRPRDAFNVYKALVVKIKEGKTLKLAISVGFETTITKNVRLARVNCKDPLQSHKFLQSLLEKLPFVVVKMSSSAIEVQYTGHVFYEEGGATSSEDADEKKVLEIYRRGRHLNEEMVKAGVAVAFGG